jgi:hypothetical protein
MNFEIYHLKLTGKEYTLPITLDMLHTFRGPLKVAYDMKYTNGNERRGILTFTGMEKQLFHRLQHGNIEYFMLNTGGLYVRVMYDGALWQKLISNINTDALLAHDKGRTSAIEDANMLSHYGLVEARTFRELHQSVCDGVMVRQSVRDHRNDQHHVSDAQRCDLLF